MKKEQIEKLREEMGNIIEENQNNFLKETHQTIEKIAECENTTKAVATMMGGISSSIYINLSNQMTSMIDILLGALENTEE